MHILRMDVRTISKYQTLLRLTDFLVSYIEKISYYDQPIAENIEIPILNSISGTVIKPRNRHDNVITFKPEYPYNFKVVFTIKGLIDKNLDYIKVRNSLNLATIPIENSELLYYNHLPEWES